MELTSTLTLAEIADDAPSAPGVLERFGLDYCCGGRRTLEDACTSQQLDVDDVLAALAEAPRSTVQGWVGLGPAELADHIETTHHAYLHSELPRLAALATKVAGVHGGRHPELLDVERACGELIDDLEPHMAREEQVLFPMVRELASAETAPTFHCGSIQNPVSVMMREHEATGELLVALRGLTGGYVVPADACASYRALYDGLAALEADTHLHIHKENNVLFPAVVELEAKL